MAKKNGKYPVREIYARMHPAVSKMTINKDFQVLEKEKLIKRSKDVVDQRSYVIPLFSDEDKPSLTISEKRRILLLNIGLPVMTALVFIIFIIVLLYT